MGSRLSKGRGLVVAGVAAIPLIAGLAAPAGAGTSCASGKFCAWANTSYGGTKLIASSAPAGSNPVGVADNDVESGKNRTGNFWCAVEAGGWPDRTIFSFGPDSNNTTLGSANNKTDHFYVRSSGQSCD